jgi:hypothetical protein
VWTIFYGDGSSTWTPEVDAKASVRCVHDTKPAPDPTCVRYTRVDGEDAVRDVETGLTWRTQSSGMVTWSGATHACSSLPPDGDAAWRLPEAAELLTLLDVEAPGPSGLDPEFFASSEPAFAYWTATVYAATPSTKAWTVNTQSGALQPSSVAETAYARCVH